MKIGVLDSRIRRSLFLALTMSVLAAAPAWPVGEEEIPVIGEPIEPGEGGGAGAPPFKIADLEVAEGAGWCSAILTWSVPDDGDEQDEGIDEFQVRVSAVGPINSLNRWNDAAYSSPLYSGIPDPGQLGVGALQTLLAPEMTAGPLASGRLWFAVRAVDIDGSSPLAENSPSLDVGMATFVSVAPGLETSSTLTLTLVPPAGAAELLVLGDPSGSGLPATPLTGWVPVGHTLIVGNLAASTTYVIALKARDASGSEGELSAAPYATGTTAASGQATSSSEDNGSGGGGCGGSAAPGASLLLPLLAALLARLSR